MLNSVNTNTAAAIALQKLGQVQGALDVTARRVSTGARVADARDDGAAFAVAQGMGADIAGLRAANEQFGNLKGLLEVTLAGLGQVSGAMIEMKSVLVRMADDTLSPSQAALMADAYEALRAQIGDYITDARYGGHTLLSLNAGVGGGDVAAYRGTGDGIVTVVAEDGAALQMPTVIPDAAGARRWLEDGGQFDTLFNAVGAAMDRFGNATRFVDQQTGYNNAKADALTDGRGALVDANLARESAQLQALQVRRQLATQSLAIAGQAPAMLLRLFQN